MKTKYKFIALIILSIISSIIIYYTVEKVKSVTIEKDLIQEQDTLEQTFLAKTNYTFEEPNIILNPYGISPLSALIIFETNDLTTPTVIIEGKTSNTTYTKTFKSNKIHILPIYGLYPNYNNKITIKVNGQSKTFNIKTDEIPFNINNNNINSSNDNLLFTIKNNYPVAYDSNGDIRWYLTEQFTQTIKRLNNGHLMMGNNQLLDEEHSTGLVEIDLLGKIYYEYIIPNGFKNTFYEKPNGNLLIYTNKTNDSLAEINRKTGDILEYITNEEYNEQNELTKIVLYSNDEFSNTKGIRLGNLNKTETIKNIPIFFNKKADEAISEHDIKITKEFNRLVIKGTFESNDKVTIILDNIFRNKTYQFDTEKTTKYINNTGLYGKYYIFIKINDTVYDFNQYVEF